MRTTTLLLALLVAAPLAAQQPLFRGADFRTVSAAGDLGSQIRSLGASQNAVWIGYTFPVEPQRHISICCGSYGDGSWNDGGCGSCSLDEEGSNISTRDSNNAPTTHAAILYRLRNGAIDTIRVFRADCEISARGAHVIWLTGVDTNASAAYLASLARNDEAPGGKKATFPLWLHPNSTDILIDIARNARSSKARSGALFWLSQTAGEKAAATLRDAVENDPDDDVKSKAVFGIAQLPDDRSIPMLVDLMRTNHNRNVRKKAAFWLGQKKDPRALDALETFLRGR